MVSLEYWLASYFFDWREGEWFFTVLYSRGSLVTLRLRDDGAAGCVHGMASMMAAAAHCVRALVLSGRAPAAMYHITYLLQVPPSCMAACAMHARYALQPFTAQPSACRLETWHTPSSPLGWFLGQPAIFPLTRLGRDVCNPRYGVLRGRPVH